MENVIVLNIPKKEDEVKNSALTSRTKHQDISVAKSTLSVNSATENFQSNSLTEQLKEVVNREFTKIRTKN